MERRLAWANCVNVRDLGGIPAVNGTVTRRGAIVRADSLDRLTVGGWRALEAYGVRTRAEVSDRDSILATLASLDVADYLRSAGLHERDLRAVRERLL